MNIWYKKNFLSYLLWPLSLPYRFIVFIRRQMYRFGVKKTTHFSVPVIVVGNITVGGTGKTPLVIALAEQLKQDGWRPGLVSRGYGGSGGRTPKAVFPSSDPARVGDEAVLLAQKTQCPLFVCRDRVAAVAALLRQQDCNIVISDDGLQHLALGRDVEIAVMDGERRLGNGFCLPAGPLREPAGRLKTVNFVVCNGNARAGEYEMRLIPGDIYQIIHPDRRLMAHDMKNRTVHAVAGIGHPQRFFNTLRTLGFHLIEHPFPDHHRFQKKDITFEADALIIMTEKDAVKCRTFSDARHWCLPVQASLPSVLMEGREGLGSFLLLERSKLTSKD